jgi:hypothetical protein
MIKIRSPSFKFFYVVNIIILNTHMLFKQTISKRINVNNLVLIINADANDEKSIAFSKISKVYISFEKVSSRTKNHFLFTSFVAGFIIIVAFPDFLFFLGIAGLIAAAYLSMHFYKFCTLNLDLTEEKVKIRFISLDAKYELVNIIQELRRGVQLSKLSASVINNN